MEHGQNERVSTDDSNQADVQIVSHMFKDNVLYADRYALNGRIPVINRSLTGC